MDDLATRQQIFNLCELRDQIGFKIKDDKSDSILLRDDNGNTICEISHNEIKVIHKMLEDNQELRAELHGIYIFCKIWDEVMFSNMF